MSKKSPKSSSQTSKQLLKGLSRRERQIMDSVYRRGKADCVQIRRDMPDPPSYSAVRAMVRILNEKGLLDYEEVGRKYVYHPVVPRDQASKGALGQLLNTFFDGSVGGAVAALIDLEGAKITEEQLDEIEQLLNRRRQSQGDSK